MENHRSRGPAYPELQNVVKVIFSKFEPRDKQGVQTFVFLLTPFPGRLISTNGNGSQIVDSQVRHREERQVR